MDDGGGQQRLVGQNRPLLIKKTSAGVLLPPGTISSLAAFATLIFTIVLAGILIVAPVAGLRPIRAFLFTRTSFPTPGRVEEPAFLVSKIASAERFDRNQEDDRRSAKKALQP